jgi:Nickel responsive protein SCO4226-like
MPKYLIERDLPGLGTMSSDELAATACASNDVLASMAPRVQWLHSYVTADKMYCVYVADDADAVREHARRGCFPADVVNRIAQIIDPTTTEAAWDTTMPAPRPPRCRRRHHRRRRDARRLLGRRQHLPRGDRATSHYYQPRRTTTFEAQRSKNGRDASLESLGR